MAATMNRITEELVFDDLTPIEVPVTLAGKKYRLREASGATAIKWRNAMTKGLKMVDGKLSGIEGVGDLDLLLLTLCLFEVKDDGTLGAAISNQAAGSIKYSVFKKLVAEAKRISDLEEGESPQRTALTKALSRQDTPIKLSEFRKWVRSLCDVSPQQAKEYEPLMQLVSEDAEDRAKNELGATTEHSA
jgi:hypothetical protein